MSALHVLATMFKVVSSNIHLKEAERTALMSELTTKLEVKLRDVPLPFSRVRSRWVNRDKWVDRSGLLGWWLGGLWVELEVWIYC